MTRLFTSGVELGDMLEFNSGATAYASTAQKRTGSYAIIFNQGNNAAYKDITASSEIYIRFGAYADWNAGDELQITWQNGATWLGRLVIGQIAGVGGTRIYVSSTQVDYDSTIQSGTVWHLIELHVKIADSGGEIEMKLDGAQLLYYSGDTKPDASTTINRVGFVMQYDGYLRTHYIDDIAINNTAGATDNSWCGDGKVICLMPNANGDSSDFVGSDGNSTDNYALVDERPSNSDTDYVYSATVDDTDLYNLAACGLSGVTITRVWGVLRAKDTTSGGGQLKVTMKTESTEYDGSAVNLSTSYAEIKGTIHTVNPNTSAAWTTTQLDALQIGPKVAA